MNTFEKFVAVVFASLFVMTVVMVNDGIREYEAGVGNDDLAGCVYHASSDKGTSFTQCPNDQPEFTVAMKEGGVQ